MKTDFHFQFQDYENAMKAWYINVCKQFQDLSFGFPFSENDFHSLLVKNEHERIIRK